jgi:hypothetical protein
MVSKLDTQILKIKVHHGGDIGFKDRRNGDYH